MTSEIYCRQSSKSSIDSEYNSDSLHEKTIEELREDIAQLEHVNSKIQLQLKSSQGEAEDTIESLQQQIRNLQLERDEKERVNAQLRNRLKFLTEYKVDTGTQTTKADDFDSCLGNRHRSSSIDEDKIQKIKKAVHHHRVLILGDSHGRHIAQLLAEDLGSQFSVSGVLKPHASLEQVTSNISDLAKGYDKGDVIAVVVGDSHVDVLTDFWDLLAVSRSTNLLLGLVPMRVDTDTRENCLPTLVIVDGSDRNESGSAYLIPIRRDRPGSLGRAAKKELSATMTKTILRLLREETS